MGLEEVKNGKIRVCLREADVEAIQNGQQEIVVGHGCYIWSFYFIFR